MSGDQKVTKKKRPKDQKMLLFSIPKVSFVIGFNAFKASVKRYQR